MEQLEFEPSHSLTLDSSRLSGHLSCMVTPGARITAGALGGGGFMLAVDVRDLSYRNGALPRDGGAGVLITALATTTSTCPAGGEGC